MIKVLAQGFDDAVVCDGRVLQQALDLVSGVEASKLEPFVFPYDTDLDVAALGDPDTDHTVNREIAKATPEGCSASLNANASRQQQQQQHPPRVLILGHCSSLTANLLCEMLELIGQAYGTFRLQSS